ncbi:uncharacterized protein LOC111308491 [Durio zibethinus]|uniref:Uncharacterized protein LOC111308491 n=1 Tax=Durio zibethinus TaxID=66656 RepID=A0A6P6ACH9_DURZI|nr:uncharacterized protein LOC111308491 [Durio zibethinus]
MVETRISTDEINKNNAAVEARANSAQEINSEGVDVEQGGAIYMECRRNYVASIGGYIVDGCEKFVKGAGKGETKEALLCATCGCHRSFHRKVLLPPHLRDTRYYNIMNYLCSLRALTVLQHRPPTPWLMRSPTLENYCDLIEGQGSSLSPDEGEEKFESDSGDEINQPLDIDKSFCLDEVLQ